MISFHVQIQKFPFNEDSRSLIEGWKSGEKNYGNNWPVVYLIHNDETRQAYIGETLNAGKRAAQHWQNTERQQLKTIHIMTDDTFNKSVILDLESFLIKYMSADGMYQLQNGNAGLADFDYFSRKEYEKEFLKIWDQLLELGLARKGIEDIVNSDLFKYSPYKSLTRDQIEVLEKILYYITGYLKKDLQSSVVVEGGAGTGKTVLAIYLLKLLSDLKNDVYESREDGEEESEEISELQKLVQKKGLRVGLIIPQQSLRETLKNVLHTINGLSELQIMTPLEAARAGRETPFDLLICDEAHRLHRREGLSQYKAHDQTNEELGLPPDGTELDWILASSRMQLLFYDSEQSVRPSDITERQIDRALSRHSVNRLRLNSQLRCLGGDDYIQYIHDILNAEGNACTKSGAGGTVMRGTQIIWNRPEFENYSVRFYDDLDQMMNEINRLDHIYHLCCAVAGYGWKWITRDLPENTTVRDINIGKGYIWNRTNTDWINSDRLPYEIGCIHTIQGYDLNYVGVIFGPEIVYNTQTQRIEVIKKNYFDRLGKAVGDDLEALRTYVLNIYSTLLTRGIRGVMVYVCDPVLREYLRPYFDMA